VSPARPTRRCRHHSDPESKGAALLRDPKVVSPPSANRGLDAGHPRVLEDRVPLQTRESGDSVGNRWKGGSMRPRSGVLAALLAALLLIAGVSTATAGETTLDWDTTAFADFGFGVTDYHADTVVPATIQTAQYSERVTADLTGVTYTKTEGPSGSPESFVILEGEFTFHTVYDPENPTWGHGLGTWRFTIETDDGMTYKCRGLILDFIRTEDRDVQRHVGPVIEP